MTSPAPNINGVAPTSSRPTRQGSAAAAQRGARKARMKNRGSQTCSSDDEDLHSDDNLRPYEEVKLAHHDKKLAGLGKWESSLVVLIWHNMEKIRANQFQGEVGNEAAQFSLNLLHKCKDVVYRTVTSQT